MKIKFIITTLIMLTHIFFNATADVKANNYYNIETTVKINNPTILKEQATIFYKNRNYIESLSYLKSLNQSDLDKESLILISNCYDQIGNLERASEALISALELNPKSPELYYNLGILHYKANNNNYAIENFEKAIKYDDKFMAAYYNLGNSFFVAKDYKKALKYYKKAYKLDNKNTNIIYNIYLSYKNLNKNKQADKYFKVYNQLKSQ